MEESLEENMKKMLRILIPGLAGLTLAVAALLAPPAQAATGGERAVPAASTGIAGTVAVPGATVEQKAVQTAQRRDWRRPPRRDWRRPPRRDWRRPPPRRWRAPPPAVWVVPPPPRRVYRRPPPAYCNYNACARAYRSFRASDCTYQPYGGGPRRYCTK
ncbi:MAG: hypothetical protein CMJ42_01850 [Phyllobacteriaceae bacterium]|nr:hypothetical protein [Phyllobacteriaceae bacterium]MBA90423.1 hypothetical protein [Phyllobacteriaceae bacterium]